MEEKTVDEKQLQDLISNHPTMKRLGVLVDKLEKVLARKSAAALTEPDGANEIRREAK